MGESETRSQPFDTVKLESNLDYDDQPAITSDIKSEQSDIDAPHSVAPSDFLKIEMKLEDAQRDMMDSQEQYDSTQEEDTQDSTQWTNQKVLLLIELFRNERNLWNPKDNYYKNKKKKLNSYLNISKSLGIEKAEIERKVKNLTSHFYREKKKMDFKKSGSSFEDNYKTKWFAYRYLEFLKDRITPRPTQETEALNAQSQHEDNLGLDNQEPSTSHMSLNNNTQSSTQTHEQNQSAKALNITNTNINIKEPINKNKGENNVSKRQIKRKQEDVEVEIYKMCKDIDENRKTCDEFSLLGKEVELKVRQLPTNYARCVAKHKIQTILFEASVGMYNLPSASTHFTGPSYQQPVSEQTPSYVQSGPSSTQTMTYSEQESDD